MTQLATQLGPCLICGSFGYSMSMGGPGICPKCDCGHFDAVTVEMQAKAMADLRAEIERLRAALDMIVRLEQPIGRMDSDLSVAQRIAEGALGDQQKADGA